jgi:putative endonuclease
MDARQEVGKEGERLAGDHLRSKGYTILETNWRFGHKEIDIIARDRNDLVIVEVKTRTGPMIEFLEQAVNRSKQRFLVAAANGYVRYRHIPLEVRFDIVCVIYEKRIPQILHIRNAFYPTL